MHSVARVGVSVSDEPAHVEAEGEEAGPQQVTQSGQVGDGEVVRVHASAPHPVDHPVRQVEKDYHLRTRQRETFFSFSFLNRNHRSFGVLKKQQQLFRVRIIKLSFCFIYLSKASHFFLESGLYEIRSFDSVNPKCGCTFFLSVLEKPWKIHCKLINHSRELTKSSWATKQK